MRGADRDALRARLREVAGRRADRRLLPEDVVADAADPSSPLHGEFEWDDRVAGHAHRIERARIVIRMLPIAQWQIVEHGPMVPVHVRIVQPREWIRDPDLPPKEAGYVQTESLGEDEGRASKALENELDAIVGRVLRAEAIARVLGKEGVFQPLLDACELLRKDL